MAKARVKYGGGLAAMKYSWKKALASGGPWKFYQSLRKKNTCKACALGMRGMKNEVGDLFEICKKSIQAQSQDLLAPIPPAFWLQNSLEKLSTMSGHTLEHAGRLSQPLYASPNSTHFKILNYKQALDLLLEHWQRAQAERSYFYASGRSSIESAYLLHLLARQWGTNNVNNCSYYCHQASGVGLKQSLGGGTATVMLEDLQKSDLLLIIGANPASNHPRLLKSAIELRRRGGKVVIINTFRELGLQKFRVPSDWRSLLFGSTVSDLYLQPHCGGDLALLKALSAKLHQEGKSNLDFIHQYCDFGKEFCEDLEKTDWKKYLEMSGVEKDGFESLFHLLRESKNIIFSWAMGVTHQIHGTETVRAIANLALQLAMIGKPGAGMMPIRGHSNVQGVGTVGVVPKINPQIAEAFAKHLKIQIPTTAGLDTLSCLKSAHQGNIDFAFHLGGNLYEASPHLKWTKEAFQKINCTVYLNTTLNKGHLLGRGKHTFIFPVLARDEEKEGTTQESMFSYVRFSEGGSKSPQKTIQSEVEILSYLGAHLFPNSSVSFEELSHHKKVRYFISKTILALEPLSKINSNPEKEFTISKRILHEPQFNTENQKAKLVVLKPPKAEPDLGKFNLMTFRSEGQFNTIIYEKEDLYRGVKHRDVVFMNSLDMKNLSIPENAWVAVTSEVGSLKVQAVEGAIRQGNVAMYFPEANQIMPLLTDPQTQTPSFKRIVVSIKKLSKI